MLPPSKRAGSRQTSLEAGVVPPLTLRAGGASRHRPVERPFLCRSRRPLRSGGVHPVEPPRVGWLHNWSGRVGAVLAAPDRDRGAPAKGSSPASATAAGQSDPRDRCADRTPKPACSRDPKGPPPGTRRKVGALATGHMASVSTRETRWVSDRSRECRDGICATSRDRRK